MCTNKRYKISLAVVEIADRTFPSSIHLCCTTKTGVKSCAFMALPIHLFKLFCCKMYRLATIHNVTDGQTDRQTDDTTQQTQRPLQLVTDWETGVMDFGL